MSVDSPNQRSNYQLRAAWLNLKEEKPRFLKKVKGVRGEVILFVASFAILLQCVVLWKLGLARPGEAILGEINGEVPTCQFQLQYILLIRDFTD